MASKVDPVLDFGKYEGKRVSEVPQYYLAWMVGYTKIGSTDLVLPKEQTKETIATFRSTKPLVYYAALEELVQRNLCLACDKPLVAFTSTRDWRTRMLHKKCYLEHVEGLEDEETEEMGE